METPYGLATDPMPFIALAYGLALAAILGFTAWTLWERRRLRQLLTAVRAGQTKPRA